MTAALELGPELQAVIDAAVKATVLALVPAVPERPLSMLPASIRRRECERRQAAAEARRSKEIDRCDRSLSTKPASVRRRKCEQNKAKKGAIDRIDRQALDLQPVNTGRATAGGVLRTGRIPTGDHASAPPVRSGPLADDVASLVDRTTGYSESARKRDRVWLYEEARRIWNEDLELCIPSQWTGPKDWGACRSLVRGWDRDVLLKAVLEGGRAWKLAPGNWSRPTLGLVLHRLRLDAAETAPTSAPKPDPRRLSGEQLEERARKEARIAAATSPAPKTSAVVQPPPRGPAERGTETRTVPSPGTSESASGVSEVCRNPGEAVSPVGTPEGPRGTIGPLPAGPLQLAEPSPGSSAEARDVLELVNATATRCRAFKTSPELRAKAAEARKGGPP